MTDKNHSSDYINVANRIKSDIDSNKIDNTYIFPSFRSLATDYNVSRNTIAQAFKLLLSEGYIEKYSSQKFKVTPKSINVNYNTKWDNSILATKTRPTIYSNLANYRNLLIDNEFKTMYNSAVKTAISDVTQLTLHDIRGNSRLIRLILQHLEKRSIYADEQNIAIIPNITMAQYILTMLLSCNYTSQLTARDSAFYINSIEEPPKNLSKIDCDNDGYNIESIQNKIAKHTKHLLFYEPIAWLTGTTTKNERAKSIYDYCVTNNLPIIELDYQSELYFGDGNLHCMKAIHNSSNVIYVSSIASQIKPFDHIAFIVAPNYLIDIISEIVHHMAWINSNINQLITINLLEDNIYNDFFSYFKPTLAKQHKDAYDIANHYLFNIIKDIPTAQGGGFCNLNFKNNTFNKFLKKYNPDIPYIATNNSLALSVTSSPIYIIEQFIKKIADGYQNEKI